MKKKKSLIIIVISIVLILLIVIVFLKFFTKKNDSKIICKKDNTEIIIEYKNETIKSVIEKTKMEFESAGYAKYYYNVHNVNEINIQYELDDNIVIRTIDNSKYVKDDMTLNKYRDILLSRNYICGNK